MNESLRPKIPSEGDKHYEGRGYLLSRNEIEAGDRILGDIRECLAEVRANLSLAETMLESEVLREEFALTEGYPITQEDDARVNRLEDAVREAEDAIRLLEMEKNDMDRLIEKLKEIEERIKNVLTHIHPGAQN